MNSEATFQVELGVLYNFVFHSQVDSGPPSPLKSQLNIY